ncbi:MAG: UDP-N-acetylmuramoyl-L-alanine--D-glutamate ligase [Micavibrio sp.]|nr:UDP-N-acetylmuramoyl-L-alanine--D-glutamate ligase [Micavibrio sp.]|tara:strand:- start:10 stop:1356 length:1347 start_codon:yes stop_codon:yes gene_type:complete
MIDLTPYVQTLKNKKIAVFGLGLSGLSVVKALVSAGAKIVAWDDGTEQQRKAQSLGAEIQNLSDTLDNSFDLLVLSPGVPLTHPKPHEVVLRAQHAGVEILGDIELLHRSNHGLKTIGITGTNGKSTTTALMEHVLNKCDINALAAGNIGVPVLDLDLTNADVLVLELSSYQLDLCPTFHPDIAMLLNITPDHLDRHGDMEGYTKAKARILDSDGVKIVGIDTPPTKALSVDTITVSVEGKEADVFVIDGVLYNKGERVADVSNIQTLRGEHNYQNIACVYATAKSLELKDDAIIAAVRTYGGLPHRQYYCGSIGAVNYINDSKATNAESAAKALSSYDDIYWIIGGLAKDGGLNGLEKFMSKVERAYLIGKAADDFKIWCDEQGVENIICKTLDVATKSAHEDAQQSGQKGTVLLAPACASWDQFKSFEKRGDAFMEIVDGFKGRAS